MLEFKVEFDRVPLTYEAKRGGSLRLQDLIEKELEELYRELPGEARKKFEDAFEDEIIEPALDAFQKTDFYPGEQRKAEANLNWLNRSVGALIQDTVESLIPRKLSLPRSLSPDMKVYVLQAPPLPTKLTQDLTTPISPFERATLDVDWDRPKLKLDQRPLEILEEGVDPKRIELEWEAIKVKGTLVNGDRYQGGIELEGSRFLNDDFHLRAGEWTGKFEFYYWHDFVKDKPARFDLMGYLNWSPEDYHWGIRGGVSFTW